MFLKQKQNGKIKEGSCAAGWKHLTTRKEDAGAPTVSVEDLVLSCTIDAKEVCDVATMDIPGAFMHANMDEISLVGRSNGRTSG